MRERCGLCHGLGQIMKPVDTFIPSNAILQLDAISEISYVKQKVTCNRCNGKGWAERVERWPVMQHGRKVGTVPPNFDPENIKSRSFLYDPRRTDWTFDGNAWVACRTLGPGDLEAVPGFVWDRSR